MNTESHTETLQGHASQSTCRTIQARGELAGGEMGLVFPATGIPSESFDRALDCLPAGPLWTRTRERISAAQRALAELPPVDEVAMMQQVSLLTSERLATLLREVLSPEHLEALGVGADGARLHRRSHHELTLITYAAFHGFGVESDILNRELVSKRKHVPCLAPPLRSGISAIFGMGAALLSSTPLLSMGFAPIVGVGLIGIVGIGVANIVRNRLWNVHGNDYAQMGRAVERLDTRIAIATSSRLPLSDALTTLFVDPEQPDNEANRLRAEAFLIARGRRVFGAIDEQFDRATKEVACGDAALENILTYLGHNTFLPDGQGGVWSTLCDLYLTNPSGIDREIRDIFDAMNELFFSLAAIKCETKRRMFAKLVLEEPAVCQ